MLIVSDYYQLSHFNQRSNIFWFVYLGDINRFLCLLQVLITRRLVPNPIQVRSIGGRRPLWKRDTLVLRTTVVEVTPHPPFSHPCIYTFLLLSPSCFAASLSQSDFSIANRSKGPQPEFFVERGEQVRDETSWRDISSPGTMACEFFKVSPCFFIYDRWPVFENDKHSIISVIVSKANVVFQRTKLWRWKFSKILYILRIALFLHHH